MQRFPEAIDLIFPAPEIPPAAVPHREPEVAPDPAAAAEKHSKKILAPSDKKASDRGCKHSNTEQMLFLSEYQQTGLIKKPNPPFRKNG